MNRRLLTLDLLLVIFGISSWISVNGLWVKVPQLVTLVPEANNLPSYISLIIQSANIGPLLWSLFGAKNRSREVITALLTLGVLSTFSLSQFWKTTITFHGTEISLGLFISLFALSLLDCTSSVLFLPFMASLPPTYLNSYLIGEGLSGLIPALLSISLSSENLSLSFQSKTLISDDLSSNSVTIYFIGLCVLMVLSLLAFLTLIHAPFFESEFISEEREPLLLPSNQDASPNIDVNDEMTVSSRFQTFPSLSILLLLSNVVSCLHNGVLPSLVTYSSLPYGSQTLQTTVLLTTIIPPLNALLSHFLLIHHKFVLYTFFVLGLLSSLFIVGSAIYCPNPMFDVYIGGFMIIGSWALSSASLSYVKIIIANICRKISEKALFRYGVASQLGSGLGALVMFLIINYGAFFERFVSKESL